MAKIFQFRKRHRSQEVNKEPIAPQTEADRLREKENQGRLDFLMSIYGKQLAARERDHQ
jgi:hypothetical protein